MANNMHGIRPTQRNWLAVLNDNINKMTATQSKIKK